MKKVVINNCFGGFSLSQKATKRLAELNGKKCYFFEGGYSKPYTPSFGNDGLFWSAFTVPNPNDYIKDTSDWADWTNEQKKEYNSLFESISLTSRPEDRADPKLVQVIEELGAEANGRCADLKIVEIPDDIEYEISEYDGNEHVAEKHRTWY